MKEEPVQKPEDGSEFDVWEEQIVNLEGKWDTLKLRLPKCIGAWQPGKSGDLDGQLLMSFMQGNGIFFTF